MSPRPTAFNPAPEPLPTSKEKGKAPARPISLTAVNACSLRHAQASSVHLDMKALDSPVAGPSSTPTTREAGRVVPLEIEHPIEAKEHKELAVAPHVQAGDIIPERGGTDPALENPLPLPVVVRNPNVALAQPVNHPPAANMRVDVDEVIGQIAVGTVARMQEIAGDRDRNVINLHMGNINVGNNIAGGGGELLANAGPQAPIQRPNQLQDQVRPEADNLLALAWREVRDSGSLLFALRLVCGYAFGIFFDVLRWLRPWLTRTVALSFLASHILPMLGYNIDRFTFAMKKNVVCKAMYIKDMKMCDFGATYMGPDKIEHIFKTQNAAFSPVTYHSRAKTSAISGFAKDMGKVKVATHALAEEIDSTTLKCKHALIVDLRNFAGEVEATTNALIRFDTGITRALGAITGANSVALQTIEKARADDGQFFNKMSASWNGREVSARIVDSQIRSMINVSHSHFAKLYNQSEAIVTHLANLDTMLTDIHNTANPERNEIQEILHEFDKNMLATLWAKAVGNRTIEHYKENLEALGNLTQFRLDTRSHVDSVSNALKNGKYALEDLESATSPQEMETLNQSVEGHWAGIGWQGLEKLQDPDD